jgi:hypothetical protein
MKSIASIGTDYLKNRFKEGRTFFYEKGLYQNQSDTKPMTGVVVKKLRIFSEEIDLFTPRNKKYVGNYSLEYFSWGGEGGLRKLKFPLGKTLAHGLQRQFVRQITTSGVRIIDLVSHIVVIQHGSDGATVVVHTLTSDQIFKLGESCSGKHYPWKTHLVYETQLWKIVLPDFYDHGEQQRRSPFCCELNESL